MGADKSLPWAHLPLGNAYLRGLENLIPENTERTGSDAFDGADCDSRLIPILPGQGHEGWVWSVTQLADGRIASGSYDKTIRIWDVEKQACVATLAGHEDYVRSVTQLADGRIASGSDDKTIRIWDVEKQACVATLAGHEGRVSSVTQLADGRIASGSDGLRIWDKRTSFWSCGLFSQLENAISVWCDGQGITLRHPAGWDAIVVEGQLVPCDPKLYPYAMFRGCNIAGIGVCDEIALGYRPDYAIPAFAVPNSWRWIDAEGNEVSAEEATQMKDRPSGIRLLWPEGFDSQALLGRSRPV